MKKYLFSCFVFIAFMTSCQKDNSADTESNFNTPKNISVIEAKDWFLGTYSDNTTKKGLVASSKTKNPFTVQWDVSVSNEDEQFSVIEFPVEFEKSKGYLARTQNSENAKAINSLIKLLVLKDKKSGYIHAALMNLHSYENFDMNSSIYKKPAKNFSGIVFYSDLNLIFINGWEYKAGELISKLSAQTQNLSARIIDPGSECGVYYVDTYERLCFDNYCSEWTLVQTIEVSSCPVNSGNGGYDISENCFSLCVANFDEMIDNSEVVSNTVSTTCTNINSLEKYKNPKWEILSNPVGYKLYSQEVGRIKLVNVQENKWVWLSLEHSSISFVGSQPLGGKVTHDQGFGTPSFTPGTTNVLYAGMDLSFNVTYTPECKSCRTIVQELLKPKTVTYKTSELWDAKPVN